MISGQHFLDIAASAAHNPFSNFLSILAVPPRDPFRALHRLTMFDFAIMIPYFTLLGILSAYGMHRYWLLFTYYRHRHNVPALPPALADWPKVTVQLPIYNEQYVVARLIDAVAGFEYPLDLLEIQVLDDSTDETQQVARARVAFYQALGVPIHYLHRDNRIGFKAGALAAGLESATGEFVAIFDADFLPSPDFLRCTLPYFTDPKIAVVQTRWTYLNRDYSALTEVETMMLDGHFVMEQGARSRSGSFFNFNGTAGIWRRVAIDDAGGWEHDTLTEDTDLSYRAQLRGWKFLYLPHIECPSELPVEMNGFKTQQARWAKGLIQTAKKILPRVFRSDESVRIKAEAFFHLTGYISYPFVILLLALLMPVMIVRAYQPWYQTIIVDLPLFIASSLSHSAFLMVSQRVLYPRTWKRSILFLPLMMAVGVGLSVRNAKAVVEAIIGWKSEFTRTPKFSIAGQSGTWQRKAYRNRAGWTSYLEIAMGLYFASTVVYCIRDGNYVTAPFLLLFVWGFMYTGLMSMGQVFSKNEELSVSERGA